MSPIRQKGPILTVTKPTFQRNGRAPAMPIARVLVVDDDRIILLTMTKILELNDFQVRAASNVPDALKYIISEKFDVLLSDLHMPGAGDGLTVVSAMRHANPQAVTLLLSAFPEMNAAASAILLQTDQILVKPMDVTELVDVIKQHLLQGSSPRRPVETVASILERTSEASIADWLVRVEQEENLMAIPMSQEARAEHLPPLFRDLVRRLSSFKPLGSKELKSAFAAAHGVTRRKQGYTAAMLVEESRLLQVSIFQSLQNNLATIDFSILLIGVMSIADEVDSQLTQAMESYIEESHRYDFALI
jgi:YesN/AraC family two-component response regulator